MLQRSPPEDDLGPKFLWWPSLGAVQVGREWSSLDPCPVPQVISSIVVHSFRVSGLNDLGLPNLSLLTGQGQGQGHLGSCQGSPENGEELAITPINGFW